MPEQDIVRATAVKLGINPRLIFERAVRAYGMSNISEQASYRFTQWFKYGEITPVIENYCLDFWRPQHELARARS